MKVEINTRDAQGKKLSERALSAKCHNMIDIRTNRIVKAYWRKRRHSDDKFNFGKAPPSLSKSYHYRSNLSRFE